MPDRLWSVPIPECFARVQAWKYVFPAEVYASWSEEIRTWDLSNETERVDFYELLLQHGAAPMVEGSVDGVLLIQAWPRMNLPEAIRTRWQPLIDAATAPQNPPPHDPGGFNAWMAREIGVPWPLTKGWRQQWRRPWLEARATRLHGRCWWPRRSRTASHMRPVPVDAVECLSSCVCGSEVGAVATEHVDPLSLGVLQGVGD